MADMDIDPPAPSSSKKTDKDSGKKRFEVKKVCGLSPFASVCTNVVVSGMLFHYGHGVRFRLIVSLQPKVAQR